MDSNFRFLGRDSQTVMRDGLAMSKMDLLGNRRFESTPPLLERVLSNVTNILSYIMPLCFNPQIHPRQFCRCRWTYMEDLGRFLLAASRLVANAVLRRREISSSVVSSSTSGVDAADQFGPAVEHR